MRKRFGANLPVVSCVYVVVGRCIVDLLRFTAFGESFNEWLSIIAECVHTIHHKPSFRMLFCMAPTLSATGTPEYGEVFAE